MMATPKSLAPKKRPAATPAEVFVNAKPKVVRVNFDLSEDDHRALRVYAAEHGIAVKDILTDYIRKLTSRG